MPSDKIQSIELKIWLSTNNSGEYYFPTWGGGANRKQLCKKSHILRLCN